MKGIVLAGGTATRLFPLTIVTNKHLLPIYDRPMIYYPIETLAGMDIREVLVIVGGKSVGDVVELLGDGRQFGLDLITDTSEGRTASPTPSALPGISSATMPSAASSATTSCAAPPSARPPRSSRPVPGRPGRSSIEYPIRNASGWPSLTPPAP